MIIPGRIALGLDLGQAQDYSALSLIFERVADPQATARPAPEPTYDVPSLYRWPLGTGYPTIVGDAVKRVGMVRKRERGATIALVVDGTGVGRPVVDMLAEKLAHLDVELIAVMITAGHTATFGVRDDGAQEWHVPKRELVSAMQVLLQGERLRIAKTLPEAATLEAELKNFRMKFTQSANAQYEAWREGDHDDLVLGTALPCWALLHGPLGQPFAAAVGGVVPQAEIR